MTEILTDSSGGCWRVATATSAYIIDLDNRTAIRLPDLGDSAQVTADGVPYLGVALRKDGEPWSISKLIACQTGAPMEFMAFGISDEPDVATYRRTTPVQRITREGAEL